MKTPKQVKLRGKTWRIRHSSGLKKWMNALSKEDREHYPESARELEGLCVYEFKTLWMPYDGARELDLNVCIHELLHGCTELDEYCVDETATDIARVLWRLGWRKP